MNINTLIKDIQHVLTTGEGWTEEVADWVSKDFNKTLNRQLSSKKEPKSATLRMSSLGYPCERKLWYSVNLPFSPEALRPNASLKFLYGDLTESLLLGLAKASGHSVEGTQDAVQIQGVVGHRDCIIDGMLIDVKSASPYSFEKFKSGKLKDDDPFGYISQLSSYLYASQKDPLLKVKNKAGFLAFEKVNGSLCLDIYDLTEELESKESEVRRKRRLVTNEVAPKRPYKHVPDGKSGNMKIPIQCSYCDYKQGCWENLRTFIYSNGPRYLTHVEREPNVLEIQNP